MKCPNCEEEVDEALAVDGICLHCGHALDEGKDSLFDDAEEAAEDDDEL